MMPTMWTAEWEEILINYYKEHEVLWQQKHEHFYKRHIREDLLNTLCNSLSEKMDRKLTIRDIKDKFRNLRTIYQRERKKIKQSIKSSSKWVHYRALDFLPDSDADHNTSLPIELDMECCGEQPSESENSQVSEIDTFHKIYETNAHSVLKKTKNSNQESSTCAQLMLSESDNSVEPSDVKPSFPITYENSFQPIPKKTTNINQESISCIQLIERTNEISHVDKSHLIPSYNRSSECSDGIKAFTESVALTLNKLNPIALEEAKLEIQQVLVKFIKAEFLHNK